MSLSDREQQILDDIEARLRADDPKLAKQVGRTPAASVGHARRRYRMSVGVFAVGFLLLLGVVPAQNIWFGVAGFAVMLLGAVYGWNQYKRLNNGAGSADGEPPRNGVTGFRGDADGDGN